ncbi:polysaccharide biosynthesis/export family protein [Phyllobacterium zundukense]|uniref:Sugar ABC transporter substrate-binding protein n=1 Tax=Phyllobacterium zundukense TaxID=1867719 RepID=A0A2N9VQT2_9HYPH|nr:polysaccharide biosynthesis/export family protein [Phyllobacterium zundukense]PIO41850.1 sugar ABC transporter substrate-binding protein [Phyllobacterium zundukense]
MSTYYAFREIALSLLERRHLLRPFARFAIGIATLQLLLTSPYASAADYKLGPMDKVSIKVVQWQTAEGAFREWPAITNTYMISSSGSLSLPFAGELQAAGKTTQEVATEIAHSVQQKLGLIDLPEASVEVLEFRPIFVSGVVQLPGKYPFDPEMTVLKAVSLAGGMRRSTDEGQRFERDFFNAEGSYVVLVAERNRLLATLARIQAELENAKTIKTPSELAGDPQADALMSAEEEIMSSKTNSVKLQLSALDELKTLYEAEIVSLEKKMVVQNRQMELVKTDLASIGSLADRGLVVNSRLMDLKTTVADMEGKLLDLDTAALRAKQEVNKAARDATDLENDRKAELALEKRTTQAALDENNLKLAMYKKLMAEALVSAPEAAGLAASVAAPVLRYSIVRTIKGTTQEITAQENTVLVPGDVVKVAVARNPS